MKLTEVKKIILIGNGGSGKSWLSKQLADITGIPLYHLDNLFWKQGWAKTPKEEWINIQAEIIKQEKWIIDGLYSSTLELRFAAAELVIFMDTGRVACICNAILRNGKKRSDLPEYLDEKFDLEFLSFLKYLWNFRKRDRIRVLSLHKQYPNISFITLKNRKAVKCFLSDISGGSQ